MTHQNEPDFYLQVEDFILNANSDNSAIDNEIRVFLLTLLNQFKHQDKE
ncbi:MULTISPECIES: hypothetical protein [unclassified Vibrio]|nr:MULTISPECIES: hypothetical protein [unclassified Vibrio]